MRKRSKDQWLGPWIETNIIAWSDTSIVFEIPYITSELTAGNYRIRVKTDCGKSNQVNFTLVDAVSLTRVTSGNGTCGETVVLEGHNLGPCQSELMSDGYHGIHRVVDFTSPELNIFTAVNHPYWSDERVELELSDFFEDSISSGLSGRNYAQDNGTKSCVIEPTISLCEGLSSGRYTIVLRSIFFGDDDGSGDLTCEDTIFQIVESNPVFSDLFSFPVIEGLSPTETQRGGILTIFGKNFGIDFSAYDIRVGTKKQAEDISPGRGKLQDKIQSWRDTEIMIKLSVPQRWEGKKRYLWLEKGENKSQYKALNILPEAVMD
jgi:hypothetical protein